MAKFYCTECGNELHESSKFCPKCGESITAMGSNSLQDIKTKNDVNELYAKFLMVYDGEDFGYRYSKSKIVALIVFFVFFLIGFSSLMNSALSEVRVFIFIVSVALIPYVIIVGIGYVYRKLSEHYWG